MVTIFPSAKDRSPDLFNLIRIHNEVRDIENIVLNDRLNGLRESVINTTTFTDTTTNTPVEFDNTVIGTGDLADTNITTAAEPGDVLRYNSNDIRFNAEVEGSQTFADTDTVNPITVNGNLALGTAPTLIALTNTMTLQGIIDAINNQTSATGIRASAGTNDSGATFFLRLQKDNVVDTNVLIIDVATNDTIATELGLTEGTSTNITLADVVNQINDVSSDASAVGGGPFNLQILNDNGVYLIDYQRRIELQGIVIANGGFSYQAGDTLTLLGGTFEVAPTITVDSVNGSGTITAASVDNPGYYITPPSDPVGTSGGSGTGAQFNITTAFTGPDLGLTESIDLTTDQILITAHGFSTGDQVSLSSPGNLPVPFKAFPTSFFYVITVDANTLQLAATRDAALNGTAIDITAHGDDYFTIKSTTDAEVYFQVWKGFSTNRVFKQRMDQVIEYFQDKQYTIFRQTNSTTTTTLEWVVRW